jgi:uncharacterized protein
LNPFVHVFEKKNTVALFDSLNLSTVYLSRAEYKRELSSPSQKLIEKEFFVGHSFNSVDYFSKFSDRIKVSKEINVIYFLLTSKCNLRCKYCFIESRFDKPAEKFMTKKMADKAIGFVKKNTKKAKIIFYGGEPLLNYPVFKHIIQKIRKQKLDYSFSIITNGSIMTDEIAKFIKENNVGISISLDGDKQINDLARITETNNGSFDRAIKTIKQLKKQDINVSISCTLGKHNYKDPGNIIKILKKYKIFGLGYNPLMNTESMSISLKQRKEMIDNLLAAEKKIMKNKIYEDRIINRKIKPYFEGKNWTRDCSGYGKQIVITPEGKIGPCHGLWPDFVNANAKNYFELDVNYKKKIKNHPIWNEWFSRTPANMPSCWSCEGIGLCGGGCAKESLIKKGSIWKTDKDVCSLVKKTIPWLVWNYYEFARKK